MVDGTLRCQLSKDGRISRIENRLIGYQYYSDVAIITPEAALEKMQKGYFFDDGYFESKQPKQVRIQACSLSYEIDTKSFYQPVYLFEVESTDGAYADTITIPAMQ